MMRVAQISIVIISLSLGALSDCYGQDEETKSRWGITFVTESNPRTPLAQVTDVPTRVVILVHGLDDPGYMWRDVIDALRQARHDVARFEYPNDGPIAESADLFAQILAELKTAGVEQTDIVVHSMGGLVTRDLLTRQEHYNGSGIGNDTLPRIDRFIMVGTPNRGSELAQFRFLSEFQERISRAIANGKIEWDGSEDGSGEAGIDLLPASDFLNDLNNRSLASHTKHTIIAGKLAPISKDHFGSAFQEARKLTQSVNAPKWIQDIVSKNSEDAFGSFLDKSTETLGDGLVTLESARLDGVDDFTIVTGSHVDIILNVIPSDSPPPAIPVILDRLRN